MFIKIKNSLQTKSAKVAGSTLALTAITAKNAFAVGVADVGVTGAFTTMGDNIAATVAAVAPFAVGVMACLLGFKYGKRIFKIIANG